MFSLQDLRRRLADGEAIESIKFDGSTLESLATEARAEYLARRESGSDDTIAAGRLMQQIVGRQTEFAAQAAELAELDTLAAPTVNAVEVEVTSEPEPEVAEDSELAMVAGSRTLIQPAARNDAPTVTRKVKPTVRQAAISFAGAPDDLRLDPTAAANRMSFLMSHAGTDKVPFVRFDEFGAKAASAGLRIGKGTDGIHATKWSDILDELDAHEAAAVAENGSRLAARAKVAASCFAPVIDRDQEMCSVSGGPVWDSISKVPADDCSFGFYPNVVAPQGSMVEWTDAMAADCNGGDGIPCETIACALDPIAVDLKRYTRCYTYDANMERCSPKQLEILEKSNELGWQRGLEQSLLAQFADLADEAKQVWSIGVDAAVPSDVQFLDSMLTLMEGSGVWANRLDMDDFNLYIPKGLRARFKAHAFGGVRESMATSLDTLIESFGVNDVVEYIDSPLAPAFTGEVYPTQTGGTIGAPVALASQVAQKFPIYLVPATMRLAWTGMTDWGVDRVSGAKCLQVRHQWDANMALFNRGCVKPHMIIAELCFNHASVGVVAPKPC